jgi:cellulose synthase/poly-beta-1,6-N-acetylglucosamine synthase-like glycosyltransferase
MLWILAVSVLGILYPYTLYPLALAMLARGSHGSATKGPPPGGPEANAAVTDVWPRVAILVSAYNEALRIEDKIRNFMALQYPPEALQMWIGTDGSTDATAAEIRRINAPRVHLVERPQRMGKTAVLNDLASRAQASIFVFTDVNAHFRPDAVRRLAEAMADPSMGVVSGRTVIRGKDGNVETEGAYYRFESWLKAREGSRGWLAGADGAIYALRAQLFRELPASWINDLAHPCEAAVQGYRASLEPRAISEEPAGEGLLREFERQTRITAQASYLLACQILPLLRARQWGMLWVLFSHKWARWIAGIWMLLGWAALAVLAPALAIAAVVAVIVLAAAWRLGARWAGMPVYFLLTHAAYLRALCQALAGERYVIWTPRAG